MLLSQAPQPSNDTPAANDELIPGLHVIGEMSGGYLVRYRGGDSLVHSSIQGMLVGQQLAKA